MSEFRKALDDITSRAEENYEKILSATKLEKHEFAVLVASTWMLTLGWIL